MAEETQSVGEILFQRWIVTINGWGTFLYYFYSCHRFLHFLDVSSVSSTSASPHEPFVSRSCRPQNAYYANKYWFDSYLIQPELQFLSVIWGKYKYVAFSQSDTMLVDILSFHKCLIAK